ncbi:uncharacterized protein FIBRA_05693 [Fibroporia radiculosa]|uniref:F-box domain-containing protein n=1 Tax=Fibroporia radiculosa TaxID=599839 RepID=J4HXY8_9APHY|nr:uncharacterized protein FIBRA_05693 [Fibroporia radiculosa]CCM03557.1 predicted protein [Fibroporia radiculosa]
MTVVIDVSRQRTSSVYSRSSEQTPPPPYEFHDTYSTAIAMTTPCTLEPKLPSFSRVQDVIPPSSAIVRNSVVSRSRTITPNLSIPHLREALHTLESKMASLLSERELLESRLEQAVRLQSPIQRLPDELLSAIFEIGVLEREEENSLLLSNMMLVCRNWRGVAVNTPVLWSRIAAGTHHSIERVRLKLERSKSVPLHVFVDFSPRMEYGSVATESLVYAMDLLRPSIWRWKTFHLTVPNRPQAHASLARCRERAPLLEVLSVRVCHSMQEDYFSNPLPLLFDGRTPRLRRCSFTSFNFNWDLGLVSRLRILKLGGYWNSAAPSLDTLLEVLRACPQLEELALRNMSDVDLESYSVSKPSLFDHEGPPGPLVRVSDTKTVQLPYLAKISFYYCGNLRTRTILGLLSFPALERIELCFLDNVSPLIEHLQRQSLTRLPLRHLRIESCFFNELRLIRLLRRLPSLTSLEFVDMEDVSSNLLKSVSHPAVSQTWICPKLTHVGLEGCTALDWESLRSFVESRLPAQSRAFSPPRTALNTSTSNTPQPKFASSASAFATHASILSRIPVTPPTNGTLASLGIPHRLDSLDLTRCHQISKEMVQWLRMYVAEVKCETVKGFWGETALS